MTTIVSLTALAQLEINEAIDWYNVREPGLGDAFESEVNRQITRISDNPLQFPILVGETRSARLRRFPYGLFFHMRPKGVLITACFHAQRDPRHWESRS